jgi:hypothetical protein
MLNVTMYKIGKVITIAKSATAEYSLKNRRRINIEIFDAKMWPRLQLKLSNVIGVDHIWCPRNKDDVPKTCPKCRSPYWNTPRKKGS